LGRAGARRRLADVNVPPAGPPNRDLRVGRQREGRRRAGEMRHGRLHTCPGPNRRPARLTEWSACARTASTSPGPHPRHDGRMHHIGIGRTHARTHILLLIQHLDIRVIHATTGELLRELTRPPSPRPPTAPPNSQARTQMRFGLCPCLETSQSRGVGFETCNLAVPNNALTEDVRPGEPPEGCPPTGHNQLFGELCEYLRRLLV
jgi:hypothetical protein